MRMQDRELVAAIVAGDLDKLGETYDRYAASLYAYCRSLLPDPRPPGEAADAVADTFIVADAKLQGLRAPDQLGSWLRAVARNECLRRLGPAAAAGLAGGGSKPAPVGTLPEVSPPAGLRERVLKACADNTPTGRAHRVSVTHRAGPFGRTGFPKPIIPPGPRWWHEVRRHPRAAAGVAAVAAAVVVAGITAVLIAGGPHRAQASTVALGGGNFGTSSAASSPPGGRSSPSGKPGPASGARTSPADGPTTGDSTSPGTRIQRRVCMVPVCRNSAERAYQVPRSIDAQACMMPMGNMLSTTMNTRPALMSQNEVFRMPSFHGRPGRRTRRQKSVSPRPSMP